MIMSTNRVFVLGGDDDDAPSGSLSDSKALGDETGEEEDEVKPSKWNSGFISIKMFNALSHLDFVLDFSTDTEETCPSSNSARRKTCIFLLGNI